MPYAITLLIILFVLPAPVVGANANSDTIKAIAPERQRLPQWNLEYATLSVKAWCGINRGDFNWPTVYCTEPYLTVERDLRDDIHVRVGSHAIHLKFLESGNRRITERKGRHMYQALAATEDPAVKVNQTVSCFTANPGISVRNCAAATDKQITKTVRLLEFNESVDIYLSGYKKNLEESVEDEKTEIIGITAAWGLGLPLLGFVVFRLGVNLRNKAPDAIRAISDNFRERRINYRAKERVRRLSEEESVSHAARNEMADGIKKQRAILREEISNAIENGDKTKANRLLAVLDRLDEEEADSRRGQ